MHGAEDQVEKGAEKKDAVGAFDTKWSFCGTHADDQHKLRRAMLLPFVSFAQKGIPGRLVIVCVFDCVCAGGDFDLAPVFLRPRLSNVKAHGTGQGERWIFQEQSPASCPQQSRDIQQWHSKKAPVHTVAQFVPCAASLCPLASAGGQVWYTTGGLWSGSPVCRLGRSVLSGLGCHSPITSRRMD